MTSDDIQAEARTWIGVPYRRRGRDRIIGIDCLGLLVMIAKAFDVPHQDETNYTDWPDPTRRMLRLLSLYLQLVPGNRAAPGLVGVFTQGRLPAHAGIFSWKKDRLHLIHARLDDRVVLEQEWRPQDQGYAFRLVRVYKIPGMTD